MASTLPGIGQAFSAMLGPVGLVVGAIAGLISILTQNAEVADELAFAMSGIKNVVRTLADMLTGLIKTDSRSCKAPSITRSRRSKILARRCSKMLSIDLRHLAYFWKLHRLALAGDFVAASKKAGDALIQLAPE